MVIGISAKNLKDVELVLIEKLVKSITSRGGTVRLVHISDSNESNLAFPQEQSGFLFEDDNALSECDMVISLGGDGTLIKTAKRVLENGIPIFGVNLGNLGYLAEVEVDDIDDVIERVFKREYFIENRLMLNARILPLEDDVLSKEPKIKNANDKNTNDKTASDMAANDKTANDRVFSILNDISLTRGNLTHSIKIRAYVDDALLEVFTGDGVIVATPTGSTAYSLSAGGSVIDPETNAISLVPVCPHIIFSRSVILSSDRVIKFCMEREKDSANISFDGAESGVFRKGQVLKIARSRYRTRMVRFKTTNFYGMLKDKLFHKG